MTSAGESELTARVSLTGPDGRLNSEAVGWARRPIIDTAGLLLGPSRTWGRTKRWEYWNVITPAHILALTVSDIDYAAVHEVWGFDRATGALWSRASTVLLARGVALASIIGKGSARARAKDLEIDLDPLPSAYSAGNWPSLVSVDARPRVHDVHPEQPGVPLPLACLVLRELVRAPSARQPAAHEPSTLGIEHIRAGLAGPISMCLRDQVVGALNLFQVGTDSFGRHGLDIARVLADMAAIGIINS